jgi:regulator of sigma E protease
VIGSIAPGAPAEKAGLKRGDRILTVAGEAVDTWDRLFVAIGTRADRDVAVTFLRDGQTKSTSVHPQAQSRFAIGDIGIMPNATPIIQGVVPNDPADKAGLMAGDLVISVNGESMTTRAQLIDVISRNGGKPTEIVVRRNEVELPFTVTPEQRGARGMIGISITEPTKTFKPGPWEAVKLSVERNIEGSDLIFRTLGGLFVGQTSLKQLQGPVAIAQLSGESVQIGWVALFSLMATLSLNLGILNLLPIPMLDGGHILIMALEGVADAISARR